ncbi:hypothetical protein ACFFMN_23455 [Planobispora siamensis]|uniref:Uncharacterized protein n=1 Tax=Planobispora siamensis TaxID=936338 RepID=A0A8J3SM06_9ACTN|nr:hypothetical protein [Planobispora siamensis]GIH95322.1 hypothetical protein Psi01_59520 [Planobispora siamensis]
MDRLSDAMRRALTGAAPCGTIREATRATERALIRRGLADAHIGIAERPARYTGIYGRTTTVYDAYLGACLTPAGRAAAQRLTQEGNQREGA